MELPSFGVQVIEFLHLGNIQQLDMHWARGPSPFMASRSCWNLHQSLLEVTARLQGQIAETALLKASTKKKCTDVIPKKRFVTCPSRKKLEENCYGLRSYHGCGISVQAFVEICQGKLQLLEEPHVSSGSCACLLPN